MVNEARQESKDADGLSARACEYLCDRCSCQGAEPADPSRSNRGWVLRHVSCQTRNEAAVISGHGSESESEKRDNSRADSCRGRVREASGIGKVSARVFGSATQAFCVKNERTARPDRKETEQSSGTREEQMSVDQKRAEEKRRCCWDELIEKEEDETTGRWR